MNVCVISGNLGKDPTTHYTGGGDPVVTFSLAVKNSSEKTNWIKCVCFRKQAEVAEQYLKCGSKVAVVGSLNHNKWETEGGETRSTIELIVNSIDFIKVDTGE
jgi:single-strand DNA-binding protein